MRFFFKLTILTSLAVTLVAPVKDDSKSRGKRQQIAFYPRRGPRPPPYAVQMEPIVQYSQRDPLYNPLANAKSDDGLFEDSPLNYYPTEPEPIIEIIIKESNESLPTPAPPPPSQARPTKEPIQVFYVKYEKKKVYGDDKPRVVYDPPVSAVTPVEKHEETLQPEHLVQHEEPVPPATSPPPPPPPPPEPSTTLRTIIRPDSEIYHAGSSGIRVTFGTDQLPPNHHNKRSDHEAPSHYSHPSQLAPAGSPKRQHGPNQPLHPVHQRVSPAFPQQRIVNSFSQQSLPNFQSLQQQQQQQQQFLAPAQITNAQRPQRLPITIQGLPDVQQRVAFNSFVPPHRVNINHPQQPGFPPTLSVSHQSVHLQNQPQPPTQNSNFNVDQQQQLQTYKQQEQEKQRHHEQRRQQELLKQHEQQRQVVQQKLLQEQQRQGVQLKLLQEQQRQAVQQKLLQDKQRQAEQQRILQQQYQQQLKFGQVQHATQNQGQIHTHVQQQAQSPRPAGDILKAVPKLEQHYSIRENPLHPGPFPPNPSIQPTAYTGISQGQFATSQQPNAVESQQFSRNQPNPLANLGLQQNGITKQQTYQSPQQFFSQNLPTPQQQHVVSPSQAVSGRPIFQSGNPNQATQKIYATPIANSGSLHSASTTAKYTPTTIATPSFPFIGSTPSTTTTTTTTTTTPTTTTSSPKKEAKIKENIANLPDEVPDDIREQLLSSGILGNADIQILDYDKVGDIPIESLPPEALANFYGAGGASAAAASEPVPAFAKGPRPNENGHTRKTPKIEQATLRPGGVEMKVVHFDPNTAQGQAIADQHIRENATRLNPVAIGARDNLQYNRYLPLKVSGASFPIPDVPELNGRKITSVVVLAPVDYSFQEDKQAESRQGRKLNDVQAVRFLAGDSLKQLIKKPTAENYKRWLEQESRSEPQRQSVVLLVTAPNDDSYGEKEIFMYDVSSQGVSKLSGELSSTFVDVAESNSDNSDTNDDPSIIY